MTLQASWIWAPGDPAPRNAVMYFRRTFELDDVPGAAHLLISADSRYILYVNGHRLGFGPVRNYQYNYQYDSYDVAAFLAPGENVVAACVQYWGEGTFQHLSARGGLIVQLDGVRTGAVGQALLSDSTWKVKRSTAYKENVVRICCQLAWEEQYDARLDDLGWTQPGFDDHGWDKAVEVGPDGVSPWTKLSPRTIPFLSDEPITPVRITSLGKARRPDFQAVCHITPYVAPGDLSANKHELDAILATVLHVPTTGKVELRKNLPNYAPFEVYLDGRHLEWQSDHTGAFLPQSLSAGDHLLLVDLQGTAHDKDYTITANGIPDLTATSPLGDDQGVWAITVHPAAEARQAALGAAILSALVALPLDWLAVAPIDTPETDIFMDMTASILVEPQSRAEHLPLIVSAAESGFEQQYLIDFGREIAGWIEFEIDAPAGTNLDLLGFEAFQYDKMMVSHSMNNTLRYTCRNGKQAYTSTVWRGLRYLIVAIHGAVGPVTLHRLVTHLATYAAQPKGFFRCSDPRLNEIWEISANTLRLCSQDAYMDCPTYEQTMWVGDAAVDVMVHQVIYDQMEFVERNLFLVADSLERLPLTNCQVPSGWESDILPNWSWLWAMSCLPSYKFSGSLEFVRNIYPYLARQAEYLDQNRQTNRLGLFHMPGSWHLIDWTDMDTPSDAIVASENCLAVTALQATAEMAEAAGKSTEAGRWRKAAAEITEAIDRSFWSQEKGAYVDSIHSDGQLSQVISQPTNVCLLFSGVAGPEHAGEISRFVVEPGPGWVPVGSPFMLYFTGEVLAAQRRFSELLGLIRDKWSDMLDRGATTTWETFQGYTDTRMYGMWTRSWCHAWSASPAYLLSRYVMGISPMEPGYRKALIEPQMGDLAWVEGKMPTPLGTIDLRSDRQDGITVLNVSLPQGVQAEIRLPVGKDEAIAISGTAASHRREGQKYIIELPGGTSTSIRVE